jgi:hypothetical protein
MLYHMPLSSTYVIASRRDRLCTIIKTSHTHVQKLMILTRYVYSTDFEQLEHSRPRSPMEALYIVLPTTANVERICQDF